MTLLGMGSHSPMYHLWVPPRRGLGSMRTQPGSKAEHYWIETTIERIPQEIKLLAFALFSCVLHCWIPTRTWVQPTVKQIPEDNTSRFTIMLGYISLLGRCMIAASLAHEYLNAANF